jgi:acetyltransferase-like isoleucine patch superfamily enzyme
VEIHEGALIGLRSTIIAHTRGPGRIVIEKQAVIAAGCLVVCAQGQTLTIGEGAVVSAGSTVSSSIPAYTLCGAPRIKAFGKIAAPFTLGTAYDAFRRSVEPMRPTRKKGEGA